MTGTICSNLQVYFIVLLDTYIIICNSLGPTTNLAQYFHNFGASSIYSYVGKINVLRGWVQIVCMGLGTNHQHRPYWPLYTSYLTLIILGPHDVTVYLCNSICK